MSVLSSHRHRFEAAMVSQPSGASLGHSHVEEERRGLEVKGRLPFEQ